MLRYKLCLLHWLEVFGYNEGATCGLLDLFDADTFRNFSQYEPFVLVHFKNSLKDIRFDLLILSPCPILSEISHHFGDNHVYASLPGQWQGAILQYLVLPTLCRVFHSHDDLCSRCRDEIHGSAHAFHHLALETPKISISKTW